MTAHERLGIRGPRVYRDSDGHECGLLELCRREPNWAEACIAELDHLLIHERARAAAAESLAKQYERDWYDAKTEFGTARAADAGRIRELQAALLPFVRAYHYARKHAGPPFSQRFFERISMKNLLDAVRATGVVE